MIFSMDKLTVKSRVFFLILVMIVFLVGLAVTSYVGFGIVNEGTSTIMGRVADLKQASELQLEIWKMVMPVNDYLITGEYDKTRNEFETSRTKLSAIIDAVKRKSNISAREKDILAVAELQLKTVADYAARIFQIEVKDIVINKAGAKLMEDMDAQGEKLIDHVGRYNTLMDDHMISAENNAKNTAAWVVLLVLSMTIGSVILGLLIGILIARGVNRTMMGVVTANTGLAEGIQQISSGNQDLSQRTSEQSAALEEIVSTLEQAAAAIDQINKNCQDASAVAEDSTSQAAHGGEIIKKAIEAINDINNSSRKISEIISVIDNIAFQTNLLALNAAVEAARAGDAGKGFAVVASEVKNLAQQSGKAAKEINRLISDTVEQIKKGTEVVNISGESLFKIIESVKKVRNYINEIAAASYEQKQGLNQINTAMGELDQVTQENSSLVEEIASASEEIAAQSGNVMELVETITNGKRSRVSGRASHV